ncbi:hypothetical protein RHS01_00091 [Rhizoctonia solani]|uniref:Uncharacterized protein n=1 Tax=Rhizoctonia solani TaxID=456999 RepID=A0A8H7IMN8_9AGAM|nr:hypothetical protein RHS01_00091 [Rhizoctonia solani]
MTGSPTHTNSNGGMGMSSHTSSGAGRPPAHKKRRMSTADTLASSTSGSERSDGTPSSWMISRTKRPRPVSCVTVCDVYPEQLPVHFVFAFADVSQPTWERSERE